MKRVMYKNCNNNAGFLKKIFIQVQAFSDIELCWSISNLKFIPVDKGDFIEGQAGIEMERIYDFQKKRHEIAQEKIRALYGHSIESKIIKTAATPPAVLYHGTAKRFISNIMAQGLLPQQRQYVHLSEDIETAVAVGTRHDAAPIILEIDSARAHSDGVLFFHGGEKIWLTDFVLPCYLKKMKEL